MVEDPTRTSDMRLRFEIQPSQKTTFFTPEDLDDTYEQKHGMLGAAFKGHFTELPVGGSRVIWDTVQQPGDPAYIKPIKPKMWFTGNATLEPGKYYKLP